MFTKLTSLIGLLKYSNALQKKKLFQETLTENFSGVENIKQELSHQRGIIHIKPIKTDTVQTVKVLF